MARRGKEKLVLYVVCDWRGFICIDVTNLSLVAFHVSSALPISQ
jgi:hypothetical protein